MKTAIRTSSISLRFLVAVAALFMLCFTGQTAWAQQSSRPADTVSVKPALAAPSGPVETYPEPYGGMMHFYRAIGQRLMFDNTTAPQRATVAFMVEKDGSLTHVRIMKSNMSEQMNAQIIRAVYMTPGWHPGTENGQPVRVQFTFPVTNY